MSETISPFAGKPVDTARLVDVPRLVTAYFTDAPDPAVPAQMVSFGTSGHRGSAFDLRIIWNRSSSRRRRRSAGSFANDAAHYSQGLAPFQEQANIARLTARKLEHAGG